MNWPAEAAAEEADEAALDLWDGSLVVVMLEALLAADAALEDPTVDSTVHCGGSHIAFKC